MSYTSSSAARFRRDVLVHWEQNGRHTLPWRRTADPYRILVSEVMLQQTQVSRVLEKYKEFLKAFPTVQKLADASLRDVLRVWSGMGYNRRAKFLHEAAKRIVRMHEGKVPRDYAALRALPGVGEYTAKAVRVFAFGEPEILIETNIRAAVIHTFFSQREEVTDKELTALLSTAMPKGKEKEWNWALMDYGVYIKKLHDNPTRRSYHYAMQSTFEGSNRQVRGAILKILKDGPYGDLALQHELHFETKRIIEALKTLARDGLVVSRRGSWKIA